MACSCIKTLPARRNPVATRKRNRPVPRSSKRAIGAVLGAAIGGAAAGRFYCNRAGVVLGSAASTGVGMAAAFVGAILGDRLSR